MTMDGVAEAPNIWQETFDEDMGAAMQGMMEETDTVLLGRVTYQEWEPYWTSDNVSADNAGFARFINTTPKYVVSRTLKDTPWGTFNNAQLVKNLKEDITNLKAQPGKTITVTGSPTLVNSLLQEDLLDELTLTIHNVAAYKGKPLFGQGNLKRFDLVDVKASRTGVILATYQTRKP